MRHIFFILCVLLSVIFAGCSVEQRCQRRLVFLENNCPDCFTTATVRDTIIREGWRHDTAFIIHSLTDTVADTFVLERERVSVRIIRTCDTLLVTADVLADTIYIERQVAVPTHVKTVEKGRWLWRLLLVLCAISGIIIVARWINKRF